MARDSKKTEGITLYLADDHTLFRKGLIRLIQSFKRIDSIREASDGGELIELIRESPPDVIVVDLHMPFMGGDDVCRWVEENHPEVKVIVLTMEDSEEYVQQLIGLGANAYLSKGASPDEVEKAIYSVVDREFYHNDLVMTALRNYTRVDSKARKDLVQFTDREVHIIQLICEEHTMKEIARQLDLSENTVQNYRSTIMDKMGVKNTAGLVKFAVTRGLVT